MPDFMSGARLFSILAWPGSGELGTFHRISESMAAQCLRLTRLSSPEIIDDVIRLYPQTDWPSLLALAKKSELPMGGIVRRLEHRMVAAKMGIALMYEELSGRLLTLPPTMTRLSIDQLAAFVKNETTIDDPENIEKLIWRKSLPVIHLAIAAQLTLKWRADVEEKQLLRANEDHKMLMDTQDPTFFRDVVLIAQHIEGSVAANRKINISADRLVRVRWFE